MIKYKNITILLLIIYIVFSYFSPLIQLQFGENILTRNLGTIVLSFLLILEIRKRKSKSIKLLITLMFLIILMFSLSFLFNVSTASKYSISILINLITIPFAIFIFYSISNNDETIDVVLKTLVICSLLNGFIALLFLYFGGVNPFDMHEGMGRFIGFDETTGRTGGSRAENYVGFWNVPAVIYFLNAFLNKSRDKISYLNIFGFIFSFLSILVSFSRSSILTALIAILGVFYFNRGNIKILKWAVLIIITILISTYLIQFQFSLMSDVVFRDQLSRWNFHNEDIGIDRFEAWDFYVKEFLSSSILFGKGPGYIQTIIPFKFDILPHNSIIDVLVEYGIFGTVLFLIPVFFTIKILFKYKPKHDLYLFIFSMIFISMFFSLLFLSNAFLKNYWLFFGLILGRYYYLRSKPQIMPVK